MLPAMGKLIRLPTTARAVRTHASTSFFVAVFCFINTQLLSLCRQIQWNKKEMHEGISISHTNTHPYVGIIQIRLRVETITASSQPANGQLPVTRLFNCI